MLSENILDILDNKHYSVIEFQNMIYPSVENAFQASRFIDAKMRKKFTIMTPYEAIYKGNTFRTTAPDWQNTKYDIMYQLLCEKFKDPDLKNILLQTGSSPIYIFNNMHDKEWGICTCQHCKTTGANKLGKMLMLLREQLK